MAFSPIDNFTTYGGSPRFDATANGAALTSGVMTSVSLKLNAGITISQIGFVSATTAAGTPTHWGYAVHSGAATPALLGSTADQTTTAFPANTLLYKPLATPVVIKSGLVYWVSFWMAATTVPTLLSAPAMTAGLLNAIGIQTTDKALCVTSGSGLTTTPPATIASPTVSLVVPVAYVK